MLHSPDKFQVLLSETIKILPFACGACSPAGKTRLFKNSFFSNILEASGIDQNDLLKTLPDNYESPAFFHFSYDRSKPHLGVFIPMLNREHATALLILLEVTGEEIIATELTQQLWDNINNPMCSIQMVIQRLVKKENLEADDIDKLFDIIHRNGVRITEEIDQHLNKNPA